MPISKTEFIDEFAELAGEAGITETCRVDFPRYMSERHRKDGRSYAEVDPYSLDFNFAVEILLLPETHRRGLIMHELGHCLCPEGSEADADRAAEEAFGERIEYDRRWPGKGLQCVMRGGLAEGMDPEDFDPVALARGQRVEMEHTSDPLIAERIAMDHLTEDPRYYEKLASLRLNPPESRTYDGVTFTIGDPVYPPGSRVFHEIYSFGPKLIRIQSPATGHTIHVSPHELVRANPPYSGWQKGWWKKPLPKDPTKIAYKTKRDALNVFLDWNRRIVDDYGGESMVHSPESFEAINHRFDIKGNRRVDTIAKAAWWALPPGSPYYLEDIDVELLNRTAPALYNQDGLLFTIPDHAEEERLLAQEIEHWERYGDIEYPEDDTEVPF